MPLVAHKFTLNFMESVNIDYIVIMFDTKYISSDYAQEVLRKQIKGNYDIIKHHQYPVSIEKGQGIEIQSEYIGIGTVDNIKRIVNETERKKETVKDELTSYSYMSLSDLMKRLKNKHVLIV